MKLRLKMKLMLKWKPPRTRKKGIKSEAGTESGNGSRRVWKEVEEYETELEIETKWKRK